MSTIIPGLYGLDSASAWRALSKDPQKYIARFADNKTVQKEIEYFNKKAPTFNSIDDLMKDRRALQYILDAHGLGSEINNAGRIRKILSENPEDENALVNRLVDPRFKALATSLRLDQGMDKLQRQISLDGFQENYIQNEFEEALGAQDNALRQAAYFARNSGNIASVYNLMGDQILRNVVTSTFNLPPEMAIQPIETQAAAIARRVDVTKFGVAGSGNVSPTQLSRAKSDHALISNSLAVSDAALKQINTLQTYLAQLSGDYAGLDALTDPAGSNAALIARQQDAVPELLRFEQLMRDGESALESSLRSMSSLQGLIDQAKQSGSDLADLKAQFNAIASTIHDKIDNAVTRTHAGDENLLLNGANDTLDIMIDMDGTTITMNRYDATAIKDYITNAAAAFNAIADHNDTGNILAAQSRVMIAEENADRMRTQIQSDFNAMDLAVANGNTLFAASLNTTDLVRGKQSVDHGLDRIARIETLLGDIGALATESKNMAAGADRTALEAQFDDYRNQLRALIEDSGTTGLDNLLHGASDLHYEITGGKTLYIAGGIDLAATIADVIDGAGLGDQASATSLETMAIMLTNETDRAKAALEDSKPVFDRAVTNYDPRGKLDIQLADLRGYIDTLIAGAAHGEQNLLAADQSAIRLDGLSSGNSLSFRPQNSFRDDFMAAIDDVMAQLSSGGGAVAASMYHLTDVVDRAARVLASDNRVATMEQGKLGATIDALDPQNTSETSALYKTNEFTQKFLLRYLTLSGSNGMNTPTSYLSNLFSGNDMASATASLMSLALSIKA